jgi:transposase
VPNAIVPDQLKSAVTGACRYEPAIQRTTAELARHYGTTILPARPRSPRDKAKVEAGVLVAERWLLARIRNETFTSLGALNARLSELTNHLNGRKMKTYKASRRDLFERLDKPALGPLPTTFFEVSTWKEVGLNIDYHFELDHHLYSGPYQLVRERLWVRAITSAVELIHRGTRVGSHVPSYVHGGRTTKPEHMPSTHRAQVEWTPSRILGWAGQEVGPSARAFFAGARSYRHVKTIIAQEHVVDQTRVVDRQQLRACYPRAASSLRGLATGGRRAPVFAAVCGSSIKAMSRTGPLQLRHTST